jgi:hypothetical protein
MPLWGNTDDAANSTISAASQVNKTPNTANQTDLFGNTTPDAYFTGATIGQFGVDGGEMEAARATGVKPAHAGWILRTEGSGGRAGRVHQEVLVAMRTITGDAEDAVYPDYILSILTQPVGASANGDADETGVFTVSAGSTPDGATLTYLWQYSTDVGVSYATTVAVSGFAGQTTDELTVSANTIADGTLVRCVVSAAGADSVTSDAAELTVTTA